jgi:hypothetical protein
LGAGHPTKVYIDHSALVTLLKQDDAHGRIAKWQTKLAEYDVEYAHIPGTQDVIADGMRRIPAPYFDLGATDHNVDEKKGKNIGKKHGGSQAANRKVEEAFVVTLEEQKSWKKWLDCE